MPLDENLVFNIARETVVRSISDFIRNRANRVPNFQILDLIIPTERRIRSVVGGMETALGTTLWEPLAKNLASLNGFEIINANLEAPAIMPAILNNTVQIVRQGRIEKRAGYTAEYCHNRIKEVCQTFIEQPIDNFNAAPRGFGVDIWLRKDDINYFFDTKTVQSNVGGYTRYFNQLINWYSYFYSRYPESNASARIVFPYNPYGHDVFWNRTIGGGWPLEAGAEGWVENEFWDFCTGINDTYTIITRAFNSISETGDLEEIIQNIFYDNN